MTKPTFFNNNSSGYNHPSEDLAHIFANAANRIAKIANVVHVFGKTCDLNKHRPGAQLSFFGASASTLAQSSIPTSPAATSNIDSADSSSSSLAPK